MKAVLIGALAATAYSADTINNYAGTYKVGAVPGTATACCAPTADIVVSSTGSVSWTFGAATTVCTAAAGATKAVQGTITATSGDATFSNTATTNAAPTGPYKFKAPTAANGDFSLDMSQVASDANCVLTLTKLKPTGVTYPGVYKVEKQYGATPSQCCYPASDVIARNDGSNVALEWRTPVTCTNVAAQQKKKIVGDGPIDTNTGAVSITADDTLGLAWSFEPALIVTPGDKLLDLGAATGNAADCSVSLTKRTLPTGLKYTGVYIGTDVGTDAACCYPDGPVTVTADGTKYKVEWTFGSETGCGTLKGQKISGSAVPDDVTKSIIFTDTNANVGKQWTLVYPVTADTDWSLDLSAIDLTCASTLEKSGYLVGLSSLVALSLGYIMF